jgi:hypothetical protein
MKQYQATERNTSMETGCNMATVVTACDNDDRKKVTRFNNYSAIGILSP